MLKTQAQIISGYSQKITEVSDKINQTKKLVDQLSFVRIGLFLAEILLFVLLLNSADDNGRTLIQIAMMLPVIGFVYVVRKQAKLDREIEYQKQLLWVYQNEWNQLNAQPNGYEDGRKFESESHPYTSDLDIFGAASLFSLINRCYTKTGKDLLASRLANKSTKPEILARQEAVREVQEKMAETFDFRANLHGHDVEKIEQIKLQLAGDLGLQLAFVRKKMLRLYVAIAPYLSFALVLSSIFIGGLFSNFLGLLVFIHLAVNVFLNSKINQVFYSFGGGSGLLNSYARAISWTENQSWKSKYILQLFTSKVPASQEIRTLSKVIQKFDARLNLLVGGFLNGLLLWDLQCCISLDKWYQASSKDVITALNNLGDFEELISLATLAHNHPEWVFPKIEDSFTLKAIEIGHPLIAFEKRISNDFYLGEKATVDIVTGSNMAGKSTFLRTLGINMILAYAGAPVCAQSMQLSVFSINSYMRIKDSLNESTSTFKAELDRLKMILNNIEQDRDTFVLIDEMLRGTNSRDKYLGSKVFIEKLIAEQTPGLFATHDLQLADLKEDHPQTVRNFHFDIQFTGGEMKFDYKLKQGPCSTFNAAILLKQIGLSLS